MQYIASFLVPLFFALKSEVYGSLEIFKIAHIAAHSLSGGIGKLCNGASVNVLKLYYDVKRLLAGIV